MIRTRRRRTLSVLVSVLAWCGPAPAHADIVLVDAVTPPCPILVDARANPLEGKAAGQLAAYLKQISGREFPVQSYALPLPARAIILGRHEDAPPPAGADSFNIRTAGERLFITGGSEQGTFYGVFSFLEQLGCRWWSATEEDVPSRPALKIRDLDVRESPGFALHDILSREAQSGTGYFAYKSRAKSTRQFTGSHTLYRLLTKAAEANPEFWPMNDKGERKPNDLHFNYLAPGLAEALAAELEKEVRKRNGNLEDFIYFAGQGDWYGGLDQSEASKKIYAEESWTDPQGITRPGNSAPLLRFINRTGEILKRNYPGIKVGTFAYMSTDSPPGKTVPAENVVIWLPRLRYGTTLSIEEAASERNPDEKSRARSLAIKASIEQWAKLAPHRLYIWEYGVNYASYVKPWPSLHAMAANIKYYRKLGLEGVMIQGNYGSTGGDLVVLKNWIWCRLLWNADQDVEDLLKQFCDGYYGPASQEMQTYVRALENSVRAPVLVQLDEFHEGNDYLRPEVVTAMRTALKAAEARTQGVANAAYLRRVREAGASLEAMQLWADGPLVEKDGKLIRADIDPQNGGAYTFDRARELVPYLRGSSKTEFGTAVSQVRGLIAANGGPVYTLRHGAVTAKVAPYQGNQRLWKVLVGDREVIESSFAGTGGKYFIPAGEPGPGEVRFSGEMGYGNWDPKAYQQQSESIAQDGDGALRWKADTRQLIPGKPLTATVPIGTAYPARSLAEARKYTAELKTAQGWRPLPITATPGRAIPALEKYGLDGPLTLRITTPDGQVSVVDTYSRPRVDAFAVSFANVYGTKGHRALVTYVQPAPVATEFGKAVPAFEREIKIEAHK